MPRKLYKEATDAPRRKGPVARKRVEDGEIIAETDESTNVDKPLQSIEASPEPPLVIPETPGRGSPLSTPVRSARVSGSVYETPPASQRSADTSGSSGSDNDDDALRLPAPRRALQQKRPPAQPRPSFAPTLGSSPAPSSPPPAQSPPRLAEVREALARRIITRPPRRPNKFWQRQEEEEFVRLINKYGPNWSAILVADSHGKGLLSARSGQDLRDKAKGIARQYIKARTPLHVAFRSLIRKSSKEGMALVAQGFKW